MKYRMIVFSFILLSGSTLAWSQSNPYGQLPVTQFPQPLLMLIRDPVVHDDLKLGATQRASVRRLTDELDVDIWSMRNKSADHATKTMKALVDKAATGMRDILSDQQLVRLHQIEMRTLGMKAFARDQVAEQLSLTQQQQEKIRGVRDDTAKQLAELNEKLKSGESRQDLQKQATALLVDEQKQILAALSPQQQQQWAAMLGRKIDVAKLGRVRFDAPKIVGNEWINSAPLTIDKLKGKVVALHFFAFA